jgi:hypothetical protein
MNLVAVDYPRNGIDQEGWCRLAPDGCGGSWLAYVLEFDGPKESKGYFLLPGFTDLDVADSEFGDVVVKCIGGRVYLICEAGIALLPCDFYGYSQMVVSTECIAFSNHLELLVIHVDGVVRYDYDFVAGNLEIVSLEESNIILKGMLTPGEDDEQWSLALEEIPAVEVTFL